MKSKLVETIAVSEADIRLGEIIRMGTEAPVELRIAAQVLLEDQIAQLKSVNDVLKEQIRSTKYDDVVSKLISEGKLPSDSYKPAIEITTKLGDVIKVSLTGDIDAGFEISKEMSDKDILDSVVPDKYKKISTTLDKKAIEADFDAGTLPDVLKSYCSKTPVEITKLRKSISKGGK